MFIDTKSLFSRFLDAIRPLLSYVIMGFYFASVNNFLFQKQASLPNLPYDYNALAPIVSGQIMELHHQKHHAAYVKNYNAAVEQLADATV